MPIMALFSGLFPHKYLPPNHLKVALKLVHSRVFFCPKWLILCSSSLKLPVPPGSRFYR
jgi:hypothetical protein